MLSLSSCTFVNNGTAEVRDVTLGSDEHHCAPRVNQDTDTCYDISAPSWAEFHELNVTEARKVIEVAFLQVCSHVTENLVLHIADRSA